MPFVFKLMADLCWLLQVKYLRTSLYHPQMDGLIKCFNQILKRMLHCVVGEEGWDWDLLLPYVLFAIRETPQASTGFTPSRSSLADDIAKEAWEEQPSPYWSRNVQAE